MLDMIATDATYAADHGKGARARDVYDGNGALKRYDFLDHFGVGDAASTDELIEAAGLNWTVSLEHAYRAKEGGAVQRLGKHRILVRDDTDDVLDMVGDKWEPLQNAEAFSVFEEFCRAGALRMRHAGALSGGQIVFALAQVGSWSIGEGDGSDDYLMLINNHRYGAGVSLKFMSNRLACTNMLGMSLGRLGTNVVSFGHRGLTVGKVRDGLGAFERVQGRFQAAARKLHSVWATQGMLNEYYNRVFCSAPVLAALSKDDLRAEGHSDNAIRAIRYQDGQPGRPQDDTLWLGFNTVTALMNHVRVRGAGPAASESVLFGNGERVMGKALRVAEEMADA